jgi:hypothetical protein
LNGNHSKDQLNEFLNVKGSKTFRRSLQDFYIIWLIIDNLPSTKFIPQNTELLEDISELLSILKNTGDKLVDDEYLKNFKNKLNLIQVKYNK